MSCPVTCSMSSTSVSREVVTSFPFHSLAITFGLRTKTFRRALDSHLRRKTFRAILSRASLASRMQLFLALRSVPPASVCGLPKTLLIIDHIFSHTVHNVQLPSFSQASLVRKALAQYMSLALHFTSKVGQLRLCCPPHSSARNSLAQLVWDCSSTSFTVSSAIPPFACPQSVAVAQRWIPPHLKRFSVLRSLRT